MYLLLNQSVLSSASQLKRTLRASEILDQHVPGLLTHLQVIGTPTAFNCSLMRRCARLRHLLVNMGTNVRWTDP
ncbi:hypothetical protein DFP97_10797 [Paenibacillus prosopidis]|uniref:Uncharacterized protein n=1 Tax=Paenibacillus prosopidis TaxID=630520 RepID=A0A368W3A4_9BACL|nr:hypothetical protein DFP97_10797 [Paenibacillus prosopidis]